MKKHLRLAALLATTILVLSSCSTQKQVRLVLLPDIQTYSRLYPDILRSQTQWAVEHADSIDFVLQQGDMTDHNIDKEWAVAASTLNMIKFLMLLLWEITIWEKIRIKEIPNCLITIFLMQNTVR